MVGIKFSRKSTDMGWLQSCIVWSVNHLIVLSHNVKSRKSVPMGFKNIFFLSNQRCPFLCAANRPAESMTIDIVCSDTMRSGLFIGNKTAHCNQLASIAYNTYTSYLSYLMCVRSSILPFRIHRLKCI